MIGKCYHNSEAYSDKLNVSIHYRSKCSNEESKIFGIVYPILRSGTAYTQYHIHKVINERDVIFPRN